MSAGDEVMLVLGRAGYEGYAAETGGKTFDGREMPTWDALPPRIQRAWMRAADAIACEAVRIQRASKPQGDA